MSGKHRLSADEAAALRAEVAAIRRRLRAIFDRLPPPTPGGDVVFRYAIRSRARDGEMPRLSVRTTARLLRRSESWVRAKVREGAIDHDRTHTGQMRIPGKAALEMHERLHGPLPD